MQTPKAKSISKMTTAVDKPNQSAKFPTVKLKETQIRITDPESPLLQGKYLSLVITNYKDSSNNTTATYYDKYYNPALVLTSDAIVQLIGRDNYAKLFNNLLSSKEYSSILSLLTPPKFKTIYGDKSNETFSSTDAYFTTPDDVNKLNILEELRAMLKCNSANDVLSKVRHLIEQSKKKESLENPSIVCNCKKTDNSSNQPPQTSSKTVPEGTDNVILKATDGSNIILPYKPKDLFHIATPEITNNYTTKEEKLKLQCLQAVYDLKFCDKLNEGGYLPIHIAASENDVDLIKRHGAMLKAKGVSIDTVCNEMTPLQIAITSNKTTEATKCLIDLEADLEQKNSDEQNLLHISASCAPAHMGVIIDAINAVDIGHPEAITVNDTLFCLETSSMLTLMALMTDYYGDTPLMLACRDGNLAAVKLLLKHVPCPLQVHIRNPTSGNTALHVAMTTALKHFEYLEDNIHPDASMLLKKEEILSMLTVLINISDTHMQNYINMTPIDLITQSKSKFLVGFVANQLNNKNIKSADLKTTDPGVSVINTSPLGKAPIEMPPLKRLTKKPDTMGMRPLKKIALTPPDASEMPPLKLYGIKPIEPIHILDNPHATIEDAIEYIQRTGNPKITFIEDPIPTPTPKPSPQITLKRSNIGNVSIAESSVSGHPNNIILVSDEKNNIAGVLTKVNLVAQPPNQQTQLNTSPIKPAKNIVIQSNQLLNGSANKLLNEQCKRIFNTARKAKTYIVKIKPEDKLLFESQNNVIKNFKKIVLNKNNVIKNVIVAPPAKKKVIMHKNKVYTQRSPVVTNQNTVVTSQSNASNPNRVNITPNRVFTKPTILLKRKLLNNEPVDIKRSLLK